MYMFTTSYYYCHEMSQRAFVSWCFITEIVWMDYWLFFTSVWPGSIVWMKPGGGSTFIQIGHHTHWQKCVKGLFFTDGWCILMSALLPRVSNLKNLKRLHYENWKSIDEVLPPPHHPGGKKVWPLHSTQVNERSLIKASWA